MSFPAETERLRLVPLGLPHLDDMVAMLGDPEVNRYVGSVDPPEALKRLSASEHHWQEHGYGRVAVLRRTDGAFLGLSGLRHWPEFGETEVGWTFRRDAWGYGYATEAGRASLDWAFAQLDFPYLTAYIDPRNTASTKVADRLGMNVLRGDVLPGFDIAVDVYALHRPRPLAFGMTRR